MVVECLSILIIILLMSFIFLRSGKRDYAFLTNSLLLLPGIHLLGELFGKHLARLLSVDHAAILIALDLLGVVISCLAIGFGASMRLPQGKQRKSFLILASGYSVILACVFIFNVIA